VTYAVLTTDDFYEEIEGIPSLERMQTIVAAPNEVSGLVEVVEIHPTGLTMWINEEGKYNGCEKNGIATVMATGWIMAGDTIMGNVLFTGGPDDDGETQGLSDEQLQYVRQAQRIREIGFKGSGIWNMTGIALIEPTRIG
jgi:Domain of unknown function (DUF3846)